MEVDDFSVPLLLLTQSLLDDSDVSSSEEEPSRREAESDTDELIWIIQTNDGHIKIKNYVQQVVPKYSDIAYQSHFRMSRGSIQVGTAYE